MKVKKKKISNIILWTDLSFDMWSMAEMFYNNNNNMIIINKDNCNINTIQ